MIAIIKYKTASINIINIKNNGHFQVDRVEGMFETEACLALLVGGCLGRAVCGRICSLGCHKSQCLCHLPGSSYGSCSPQSLAVLRRPDMAALLFYSISFLLNP